MSDNPGLQEIIQKSVQDMLASPEALPAEFWDYAIQHATINPVPVQATISPTIIASGVGSSSNTPTRYVGGTSSGAPTSGTYVVGDFVISHDGHVYVCTAAGSPGTWTASLTAGEIAYASRNTVANIASTTLASPTVVLTSSSTAYTGADIYIEIFTPGVVTPNSAAGDSVTLLLQEDGSNIGTIGTVKTPAAATMAVPFYAQIKRTPSAGSHTYGLAAIANTTTGTPQIISGPGGGGSFYMTTMVRTRYA